jgi:hypothetical protein
LVEGVQPDDPQAEYARFLRNCAAHVKHNTSMLSPSHVLGFLQTLGPQNLGTFSQAEGSLIDARNMAFAGPGERDAVLQRAEGRAARELPFAVLTSLYAASMPGAPPIPLRSGGSAESAAAWGSSVTGDLKRIVDAFEEKLDSAPSDSMESLDYAIAIPLVLKAPLIGYWLGAADHTVVFMVGRKRGGYFVHYFDAQGHDVPGDHASLYNRYVLKVATGSHAWGSGGRPADATLRDLQHALVAAFRDRLRAGPGVHVVRSEGNVVAVQK